MSAASEPPRAELPGRPLGGVPGPMPGLDKIRVLDFTKLLPGPYATELLAELGFSVLKLELPHFPDEARHYEPKIDGVGSLFKLLNGAKQQRSLDFRKPEGLKEVLALADAADVVVEGFRPGLMDRIGLGWDALRARNPRLVYCSLVGYPPEGAWARKAGHDLNFLSLSGFLGLSPRPSVPPTQLADLSGSMAAAAGILAALLSREKTGEGRRLQVSMSTAAHSWLPVPLSERRAEGRDPEGPRWWNGEHPFYRLYDAADGRRLAVAALEKSFALALLDALELGALKPLADDPLANAAKLSAELARVFATAPQQEWTRRLEDKDVCVTPVLGLGEAEQFQAWLRAPSDDSSPRRR